MTTRRPDLQFGPGANAGFSTNGVFDDLHPAKVVRELIQNSLDAARVAEVEPAVVRFRLARVCRGQIPGIAAYERAFQKAADRQRDPKTNALPGQAQLIANRIRNALGQNHVDILSIMDNGVGLDKRRMDALLGHGVSAKESGATGTYGNGHLTAIPASDLRYLLYGGVTDNGHRIGAGHAILASHHEPGEVHLRGADGLFIRGFRAGHNDYATDKHIPDLIRHDLNYIQSTFGHGTTVIITTFNHFLEDLPLWDMVSKAAASNFFVAIEQGALKVVVEDNRCGHDPNFRTLDRSTLLDVLTNHRNQKRADAFLNGQRAFNAHRAFRSGRRRVVETASGALAVHLQESPEGATRIDLCRNGMWITDDKRSSGGIPGFYYKFRDRVPFQAVLSLDARDGGELHDLVSDAEGPLHDSIRLKPLPNDRQSKCKNAFDEIRNWILDNTQPIQSDAYKPSDFLALDFGEEGDGGGGKAGRAYRGTTPVPINRYPARQLLLFPIDNNQSGQPNQNNSGKRRASNASRSRQRPSLPTLFQAASCPVGKSRRRIMIECVKDCPDAELRLVVDEALDATCDRPNQDSYTPATLDNVTINGTPVSAENMRKLDDRDVGVLLGDITAGSSIEVETDYCLSGDFNGLVDPSLRVELFKSQSESKTGTVTDQTEMKP